MLLQTKVFSGIVDGGRYIVLLLADARRKIRFGFRVAQSRISA